MNGGKPTGDASNPDKYVEREVTDLRIEIVRFEEKLRNLTENTVTHKEFANWKLDSLKWIFQLTIPLLAVLIGFALSHFFIK